MITAILDRFRQFHDRSSYVVKPTASGVLVAKVPGYLSMFPHETGPYWMANDWSRLIERYSRRSHVLLQQAQTSEPLFIFSQWFPGDLRSELLGALETIVPGGKFRLLIIDYIGEPALDTAYKDIRATSVRASPLGRDHRSLRIFNTKECLEFERPLVEAVAEIMAAPW